MEVKGNVTIGTYNENPITVVAQNNTKVNVQPQMGVNPSDSTEPKSNSTVDSRPVYFNKDAVAKVDLCRVIMALREAGAFIDGAGQKSRQKDVFAAFSKILNTDLSNYDKALSEGRKKKLPITVFDHLENAFKQYESDKE